MTREGAPEDAQVAELRLLAFRHPPGWGGVRAMTSGRYLEPLKDRDFALLCQGRLSPSSETVSSR
jgi:hypothetical protein